jgi:hypothetical protein
VASPGIPAYLSVYVSRLLGAGHLSEAESPEREEREEDTAVTLILGFLLVDFLFFTTSSSREKQTFAQYSPER